MRAEQSISMGGLEHPDLGNAERLLAAASLVDPRVAALIEPRDTSDPRFGYVVEVAQHVAVEGGGLSEIANHLERRGLLERVGGRRWLAALFDDFDPDADLERLARQVRIGARLRQAADVQAAFGRQLLTRHAAEAIVACWRAVEAITSESTCTARCAV